MSKHLTRGSLLEPTLLLITLSIIIFLFILPSRVPGPQRSIFDFSNSSGSTFRDPYRADDENVYTLQPTSSHAKSISIKRGNAASSYQPREEYIVLENNSRSSIDITGWKLTNGKDRRVYELGNTLQRYPAEEAYIPSGTKLLSASNILQNIVLEAGEEAVITTGKPSLFGSIPITSFKENMCTGYLENTRNYDFTPSLRQQCPDPSEEPGFENLDEKCQDFINGLRSCAIPDIGGRDEEGDRCDNCVNGERISRICRTFIETHYNYQGCVAYHGLDEDFYLDTWRVFLGKTWEMWAKSKEVISLFDKAGSLVDYLQY